MGCDIQPEILLLNKRTPTKCFLPNIRYSKTEDEAYKLPKIIKPKVNLLRNDNLLNNIRSNYILQIVFQNLNEKNYLQLISKNKKIQNKLEISIGNYKNYKRIEIEIELIKILKDEKNFFIIIFRIN